VRRFSRTGDLVIVGGDDPAAVEEPALEGVWGG
jgi:hypothetical protein